MSSIKKTSGLLQRDTGDGQKKVAPPPPPPPKKKRCLPGSIKYAFVPVWVAVKITVFQSITSIDHLSILYNVSVTHVGTV